MNILLIIGLLITIALAVFFIIQARFEIREQRALIADLESAHAYAKRENHRLIIEQARKVDRALFLLVKVRAERASAPRSEIGASSSTLGPEPMFRVVLGEATVDGWRRGTAEERAELTTSLGEHIARRIESEVLK